MATLGRKSKEVGRQEAVTNRVGPHRVVKNRGWAARLASAALVAPLIAVILAGSACSKQGSDSAGSSGGATSTSEAKTKATVTPELLPEGKPIRVLDNRFVPEAAIVSTGRAVEFENAGRNDHDVLSAEPGAFVEIKVDHFHPGDTATITFDKPGTYQIYCSVHGNKDVGMVGTVIVR